MVEKIDLSFLNNPENSDFFPNLCDISFGNAAEALTQFYREGGSLSLQYSHLAIEALSKNIDRRTIQELTQEESHQLTGLFDQLGAVFIEDRNEGRDGSLNTIIGLTSFFKKHPHLNKYAVTPIGEMLVGYKQNLDTSFDYEDFSRFTFKGEQLFDLVVGLPFNDAIGVLTRFYSENEEYRFTACPLSIKTLDKIYANRGESDLSPAEESLTASLFQRMALMIAQERDQTDLDLTHATSKELEILISHHPHLKEFCIFPISEILSGLKRKPNETAIDFLKRGQNLFQLTTQLYLKDTLHCLSQFYLKNQDNISLFADTSFEILDEILEFNIPDAQSLVYMDLNPFREVFKSIRSGYSTLSNYDLNKLSKNLILFSQKYSWFVEAEIVPPSLILLIHQRLENPNMGLQKKVELIENFTNIPSSSYLEETIRDVPYEEASIVIDAFSSVQLDYQEQKALEFLFRRPVMDSERLIFTESLSHALKKIPPEGINKLVEILKTKSKKFSLAAMLTCLDSDQILTEKSKELLGFKAMNVIPKADVLTKYKNWFLCYSGENRFNTALTEGGYVVCKIKGAEDDAGIVVKMYGKMTGLVTRPLKIGKKIILPGTFLAPTGIIRQEIETAFLAGKNEIFLDTSNQTNQHVFALMRMVNMDYQEALLTRSRQILTNTPTPNKIIAGKDRLAYYRTRIETDIDFDYER